MTTPKTLFKSNAFKQSDVLPKNQLLSLLIRFQSLFGLLLVIGAASIICTRDGENLFLAPTNLANVVRSISENGIMAIGMTLVILIGGIDLSVGAILGLTATAAADLMMNRSMGMLETIVIVLALGAAFGAFNGIVSTKLGIQAFIVTLASMSIARGLARFWSGGIGIPVAYGKGAGAAPQAFSILGERIGGIPVPAICFLFLGIIFIIMLNYTKFGRHVYAIGGNETAAHLSGIKINRVKIMIYVTAGVLSAIAGTIHAAQVSQGSPNDGIGYELNAIAAVAIGGTSLAGGKGTIVGTIIGALILGVLDNMLGLKNVNTNLQLVVKGLIIIIAVVLQKQKS
ncbi:ABC transporter permease [Paenibacillus planticolens]|uniref:ABC transporter permease n=1 Tax=Paenibacillus planticolens TaxID=2654976 RepID=A0ABX1ZM42_9BACL|nr:ABC transporter permease [Paenibacillus planticolens]NOV01149.1 ABC transporter permease [Paenibacillus planticolens]